MRAIWSGSLSFGLINIPVKIYSASKDRALKFRMLDKKNLCPIGYSYICKNDNKTVSYDEIVRGYEFQKGEFVVLEDEDFKKANVRKTKTIEVIHFTETRSISSKYYDKPYYIEPDQRSQKAYVLLRDTLKKLKRSAVASFVFKDRERIGIIKPDKDVLLLNQLRFEEEIRKPEGLSIPVSVNYSKKELEMAVNLVRQLTEPFKISNFKDTYTKELERVIEEKSKGKKPTAKGTAPKYTQGADLMALLKKSLEKEKKAHRL